MYSSQNAPPLTAERAMMEQIRSKLERAAMRLDRAPSTGRSSGMPPSSRYFPTDYSSKPAIRSVYIEDIPSTVSRRGAPSSTATTSGYPPLSRDPYADERKYGASGTSSRRPPPSTASKPMRQGVPPPSTQQTQYQSSRHRRHDPRYQYQSTSRNLAQEQDYLNGGPPPMSSPFLVYSSSRTMGPQSTKPPMSKHPQSSTRGKEAAYHSHHHHHHEETPEQRRYRHEQRERQQQELHHRREKNEPTTANGAPPSAMRSAFAPPPSSRVRFHDEEHRKSTSDDGAKDATGTDKVKEPEREPERATRKHREKESHHHEASAQEREFSRRDGSPVRRQQRKNPATLNPPSSAIKVSAYEDAGLVMPTSPAGERPRKSSLAAPLPKSEIKVSAFAETPARRRGSVAEEGTAASVVPPKSEIQVSAFEEVTIRRRGSAPEQMPPKSEIEVAAFDAAPMPRRRSAPEEYALPAEPEPIVTAASEKRDAPNDNVWESEVEEDIYEMLSPIPVSTSNVDTPEVNDENAGASEVEVSAAVPSQQHLIEAIFFPKGELHEIVDPVSEEQTKVSDEKSVYPSRSDLIASLEDVTDASSPQIMGSSDRHASSPAVNGSTSESVPSPLKVSLSLSRSPPRAPLPPPVPSSPTRYPPKTSRARSRSPVRAPPPLSVEISPTRSPAKPPSPPAAMPSRSSILSSPSAPLTSPVLARHAHDAVPATIGGGRPSVSRPKSGAQLPQAPQTLGAGYIRRSRAKEPLDLKRQLPPSIAVLSGLSNGPNTFILDEESFYEIEWKTGEFGFSFQRVYAEEDDDDDEIDGTVKRNAPMFLRMLLNTDRSTCKSFRNVRAGDVLIKIGDKKVSELGLDVGLTSRLDTGHALTKFFTELRTRTPMRLTFQRMDPYDWEGGVEL